jgi:hypothetical protein
MRVKYMNLSLAKIHTETESRWTEAVRPAALEPFPDVYTAIGATFIQTLTLISTKEKTMNLFHEL